MIDILLIGMVFALLGFALGVTFALIVDTSTTEKTKVYYTDYGKLVDNEASFIKQCFDDYDKIIDKMKVDMCCDMKADKYITNHECPCIYNIEKRLNDMTYEIRRNEYKIRELRERLNV